MLAQFEAELVTLIEDEIKGLRDQLENNNFDTVAQFRFVMGRIHQLKEMRGLMDEAHMIINK